MGETQDATMPNPLIGEGAACPATVVNGQGGVLAPFLPPHSKEHARFKPIGEFHKEDGSVIFGFGQNMAGWIRVSATAGKRTAIKIRHGEILGEGGNLDVSKIGIFSKSGRFQTDALVLDESHPLVDVLLHFAYHGFRCAEVAGNPWHHNMVSCMR